MGQVTFSCAGRERWDVAAPSDSASFKSLSST